MKTLKKNKLTQLNKVELDSREQNRLLGGANCCICGCATVDSTDNFNANINGGASGLVSPGGGEGGGSFAGLS